MILKFFMDYLAILDLLVARAGFEPTMIYFTHKLLFEVEIIVL